MISFRERLADPRGGVAVIVAVALMFVLAMLALGVDGGKLYSERRSTQNAADHAAYAAAWAICNGVDPLTEGYNAASRNGYDNNGTSNWVTVSQVDADTYSATIVSTVSTVFSGAIGATNLTARGFAEARQKCGGGAGAAVFGGSTTCTKTIDWSGSVSGIDGGPLGGAIHSNNDIHVSGSNNNVQGHVTYAKNNGFQNTGQNNTFDPPASRDVVKQYPVDFKLVDYQPGGSKATLATSQGRYRNAGNNKIDIGWLINNGYYNSSTKVLQHGLYRTTNEVDLSDSGITGPGGVPAEVTFVSSAGVIKISGSNQKLKHWDPDGLLAYTERVAGCGGSGIDFNGSSSEWEGILYAPKANVSFSGSSNTSLVGNIIGDTVKLGGSTVSIGGGSFGKSPGLIELRK